jgi:hypothetical protein
MLQAALSELVVAGLKTIALVQLADAARLEPQVVDETAKSAALAPEMAAGLRVTLAAVPLVTVMDCAELVDPWTMLPKERLAGEAVTLPEDVELVPRPVSETRCGLLGSVSVMVSAAVRVPDMVGLKSTVTVQLAEAASVEAQVFL